MKRKGCCGASVSSPRKREGLEYRAHTKRVVSGRKRKERGGQTMNCGGKIVDPMVGKLGNSDRMATVFSMKYQK